MQIVIPMSGFGERFRKAGYTVPKPLIEVEGKPIIAHVVDLFPGETDFTFICNREHLAHPGYRMAEIIRACCPDARIVGIAPHKQGPVHAVAQVLDALDPGRPVIVNYCDFTCLWDWRHFREFVRASGCDGAIPAYRGFHPHSLGTTNYAYLREHEGWVQDIREKMPFTADRMQEYASSGTYYFRSADLLRTAIDMQVAQELTVGGEYYASLSYLPLLASGKRIAVYPLQHFMQWGTPEDVAEYQGWSQLFRRLVRPSASASMPRGSIVMPMAGLGERFSRAGYPQPKPLIPVSGKPMAVQAACQLPSSVRQCFVIRSDMPGADRIAADLQREFPASLVHRTDALTDGQALSAKLGLDALAADGQPVDGPITLAACDTGYIYSADALDRLIDDPDVDLLVWVARGLPNAVRNPQQFGWVDALPSGQIRRVSVKQPLASPAADPIVTGTFTFRRADDFIRSLQHMLAHDDRVNGEFYLDTCVNHALALGLRCHVFEVDHWICWGTPNDLRTFRYWQSCFDQWSSHPYRLEDDAQVPPHAVASLRASCHWPLPDLPGEYDAAA